MKNERRDDDTIWGHSENEHGEVESLELHLRAVASRCGRFAEAFGCRDEGFACGLLHDLGKLGESAQRRLHGIGRGVDHWSFGAHYLFSRYGAEGVAAAFSALGHHQGLGRLNNDLLRRLPKIDEMRELVESQHRTFSETPRDEADTWLALAGLSPPESMASLRPATSVLPEKAATMADIRMLFSALVDADFLETEAHFRAPDAVSRYERPLSPGLQPERARGLLNRHVDKCRQETTAPEHVVRLRDDLLAACLDAARGPSGVYTLSAPTGGGKTLAMLAFALEHAARHDLRRIVLVVPYLSIIEQTARIYRGLFESEFGPHYVLEHHSLATGPRGKEERDHTREEHAEDSPGDRARLMAENWDAPIVITTSVQFFESLFSNRPSACRKLHRLSRSVVLFDEVQTFPTKLAIPTLATLSHLARRHACTTVFATATQPAFSHFDKEVQKIGGPGWRPNEIVPSGLDLFRRAKRTTVHWPHSEERTGWDELAGRLAERDRVMCIVNLKRHAIELLERLRETAGGEGLFHLSTNMCPAHREETLGEVRARLDDPASGPCRLVATQCVEAGVDIDFPTVYRAMGPLEAVAQAAGRCNRHGRRPTGDVHVFRPEGTSDDENEPAGRLYPSDAYRQAAMRTEAMLRKGEIDIDDPRMFREYYDGLYSLNDHSQSELIEAIKGLDFEKTACLYRLIKQQTVNLVVPFDQALFDSLWAKAHERGLSGDWLRRARPLSVSVYGSAERLQGFAEPVPLPDWVRGRDGTGVSDEWFLLPKTAADHYDRDLLGLGELPKSCCWIA